MAYLYECMQYWRTSSRSPTLTQVHCSSFHRALKLDEPHFLLLLIRILIALTSPIAYGIVVKMEGKSECAGIWQTENMVNIHCVVCSPK